MDSALIVPVPEAGPVVGDLRARLDPASRQGVPAHITVMIPFLDPSAIDAETVERLGALFASVPAFDFALTSVGWFGSSVVWLAPEPSTPFRSLTASVRAEWPELKPYDGEFDEVVPHLTIAQDADREALVKAGETARAALPIHARATEVRLIARTEDARWTTRHRFALRQSV